MCVLDKRSLCLNAGAATCAANCLSHSTALSGNHRAIKRQKSCYTFKRLQTKCFTHTSLFVTVRFATVFPFILILSLHSWFMAWSLHSRLQPTHTHTHTHTHKRHQEDNDSHRVTLFSLYYNQNDIMTALPKNKQKGKVRWCTCKCLSSPNTHNTHTHAHMMFCFMWICVLWSKS